jgi:hypothetical protein
MSVTPITNLSTYAKALGKAYCYVTSTPATAASWNLLGITEGDIAVEEKFQYNDYKLPEWTGDAIHSRDVDGSDIAITLPLIWGDSSLYDLVHPLGEKGGGRSAPTNVVPKTVLIVSLDEVGAGLSNGADGQTWTPAEPVHAIWLHKAIFEPGPYAFKHSDGGKVIRSVIVRPMFDSTQPEGQMLYTIGDPYAQGVTTYRI